MKTENVLLKRNASIRDALELAARCTLESELPQALTEPVRWLIANKMAWIQPVFKLGWDEPTSPRAGLFWDVPTVIFPYKQYRDSEGRLVKLSKHEYADLVLVARCPKRLLLLRRGEALLAELRIAPRKTGRRTRTEMPANVQTLAALTAWHGYDNGSVINREPATNRGLAEKYELTENALCKFLKTKGLDAKRYAALCARGELGARLMLWNGELPSRLRLPDDLPDTNGQSDDDPHRVKRGQRRLGRTPGSSRRDD